jgi:hypothetical protein
LGDCYLQEPRKVISTRPGENFHTKLIVTGGDNFGVLFESFFLSFFKGLICIGVFFLSERNWGLGLFLMG